MLTTMQMDRTSILGDTLDYMKELLEKINKLKMQDTQANSDQKNSLGNLEEVNKIGEATAKNTSRVRMPICFFKITIHFGGNRFSMYNVINIVCIY